ncbi:DUF429 domain-containing protein [Agrococcus sp. ProA11]|uniref:DUF429 domain-containing protein n=1 Tax=Agrococcus chionoecetis TaxID=3153752 RepID=UPI0032614760
MSEDASVHVGIDLAWGPKNRTGLGVVAADGRLLASGSAGGDDEIVEWIRANAPQLGVVAIDAPLIVTNAVGRRMCESFIHAAFGRYDASPHSTNLGNPEMNPPRGAVIAERLGLPVDPDGPRDAVAIEVYPHPAMVGLWELDLILKYKHKAKYEFSFRKEQFGQLLTLLKGESSLRVAESPRWGEIRAVAAQATKHSELNRIEDEVDGIVCAWLAYLWANADERLEVYGDTATGYIVAPEPPRHRPRPRSERQAPRSASRSAAVQPAVRFVDTGSDRADAGAVVGQPEFYLDGPSGRRLLTSAEARMLEGALAAVRDETARTIAG